MWFFSFLTSGWMKWIIAGVVGGVLFYYIDDYRWHVQQLAIATDRQAGYIKSIEALEQNAAQCRATIKAQEDAREDFRVDTEALCKAWSEVRESDTPVGDLLEKLKEKESEAQ